MRSTMVCHDSELPKLWWKELVCMIHCVELLHDKIQINHWESQNQIMFTMEDKMPQGRHRKSPSCALLLMSFKSSLNILHTEPISRVWFVNIFSHSVCHLFSFLIVSFDTHKFIILIKSIYFFLLLPVLLIIISKKWLPNQC